MSADEAFGPWSGSGRHSRTASGSAVTTHHRDGAAGL